MKLPSISSEKMIKVLEKIGFEVNHQKGSHIVLRKKIPPYANIVVPRRSAIAKGTMRAIIRQAGLTRGEFLQLLEK